jgi:hypothetical protein
MWKCIRCMGEGMTCILIAPKYYKKASWLFREWMTLLYGYRWEWIEEK